MKKFLAFCSLVIFMVCAISAEALYVCVGSFVNIDNAMNLAEKMKNDDEDVCISEFVRSDGQLFYRVLLKTNTEDKDVAREEADNTKGAFIVIPKAEENIRTISKAKNVQVKEPEKVLENEPEKVLEIVPEIKEEIVYNPIIISKSPVTLKSGATKTISSIADFAAFIKTVTEDSEEDDGTEQIEYLIDFFEELFDSEELMEEEPAKQIAQAVERVGQKIENFLDDFSETQNGKIEIDEEITNDLSELIPGFSLKNFYIKGNGNVSTKLDDDDEIEEITFDINSEGALSYRYNLRESGFKTFLKDMTGEFTVKAFGKGNVSEDAGTSDTDVEINLRQETAVCNSKGLGGVILLEGSISCKGNIDPQIIGLVDEDEEAFIEELGKILNMEIKFYVYDDEGKLYYMSSFNNLESLFILVDTMDL